MIILSGTASNVSVGKPVAAGAIFSAVSGTTAPTDATTALAAAFGELGYANDSGLVNSIETDSNDIKAWGGDVVLSVRTSRKESFKYTLIEALNVNVLKEAYGQDNVTGTLETGIAVKHSSVELPHRVYVFEILLTGNRVKRIVVPDGQVSEVADVSYTDGDPIGYETTLVAYPDADGNTAYEYIAKIAAGGGGD